MTITVHLKIFLVLVILAESLAQTELANEEPPPPSSSRPPENVTASPPPLELSTLSSSSVPSVSNNTTPRSEEMDDYQPRHVPPQELCDKYCFANCMDYREKESAVWTPSLAIYFELLSSSAYGECIISKRFCSCATQLTFKNPLLVMIIVVSCTTGISVTAYYTYKMWKRFHGVPEAQRTARPPSPIDNYPDTSLSSIYVGNERAHRSSTMSFMNNPLFMSSQLRDAPPDYLPPPSYSESLSQPSPSSSETKPDTEKNADEKDEKCESQSPTL